MRNVSRFFRCVPGIALTMILAGPIGCSKKTQSEPKKSPPAEPAITAPPAHTQPAAVAPSASRPAQSQPATTWPASSYDPNPPYTVKLFVRHPEEKQPGWLKIVELSDPDAQADVLGHFPEKNHIHVDTENVQQLRIDIGFLPLEPGKRTFLHIDKQGIEITRSRTSRHVLLLRRPTGEWTVAKPPKK